MVTQVSIDFVTQNKIRLDIVSQLGGVNFHMLLLIVMIEVCGSVLKDIEVINLKTCGKLSDIDAGEKVRLIQV